MHGAPRLPIQAFADRFRHGLFQRHRHSDSDLLGVVLPARSDVRLCNHGIYSSDRHSLSMRIGVSNTDCPDGRHG